MILTYIYHMFAHFEDYHKFICTLCNTAVVDCSNKLIFSMYILNISQNDKCCNIYETKQKNKNIFKFSIPFNLHTSILLFHNSIFSYFHIFIFSYFHSPIFLLLLTYFVVLWQKFLIGFSE